MEATERPNKIQKRDHSADGEQVAEFAAPTAANGNGTTTDEPVAPTISDDPECEASTKIVVDEKDAKAIAEGKDDKAKTAVNDDAAPPMSKSALKKARKLAEWEAGREDRKVKRKEKIKANKEAKREEIQAAIAADPSYAEKRKEEERRKAELKASAKQLPVTFIFDCDFDDKMLDTERKSLAQQLTRSYSDTRNNSLRAHLAVASFGGKLKERFEGVLDSHHKNWKGVRFFEEDFVQVAAKAKGWMKEKHGGEPAGPMLERSQRRQEEQAKASNEGAEESQDGPDSTASGENEVIYLSSDSGETLHELKPHGVYIIGGLVDKNRHKGICHQRAQIRGIRTAKLPIGDYLEMSSRKVLAVNHVNQIMLKWLECGDWGEAFLAVMPKRKGGHLKKDGGDADGDEDEASELAEGKPEDDTNTEAPEASQPAPDPVDASAKEGDS